MIANLDRPGATPMRLFGVTVHADSEAAAPMLDEISLSLAAGEWIHVVGVNGCGKSTLARLLAGLYDGWRGGEIDRAFAGMRAAPVVLQRPQSQLFGETPREEVQFALEWHQVPPDRIANRVNRALEAVGLSDWADTRWEGLSGGQMQLAAIAAAAACESPLLLFDEATSMLDDANRGAVIKLARDRHRRGTAIVWVTQRLDEIGAADRVVALADGRLLYDGDGRTFLYGKQDEGSPCEACGLRLPYLAEAAREMKRRGRLANPLPLSDEEWREVLGDARRQAGTPTARFDDRSVTVEEQTITLDEHTMTIDKCKSTLDEHLLAIDEQQALMVDGLPLQDGTGRLTLAPGTVTLVAGANGAGKSHFLEKLAGLRDPEGCAIRYGNDSLWLRKRGRMRGRRLNPQALLRYGYAGQAPEQGLIFRSLDAEMQYSLQPYARQAGVRADELMRANADRALSAVGWDRSWLPRDPHRMSGGERRRAALAALFATEASWLLLDEPTAGLDREGHEQLARHLTQQKLQGCGIVLVSHDLDWALPLADRVLLLQPDGGMMMCSPDELVAHPERLTRVGLQAPLWLRIAAASRRDSCPNEAWRSPQALADALAASGRLEAPGRGKAEEHEGAGQSPAVNGRVSASAERNSTPKRKEATANVARRRQLSHRMASFDPRAVWLGYVLLSIGLFSLSTWPGLLAGAATVIGVIAAARIPLRRWRGIIIGYVAFGILFAGWAALDWFDRGGLRIGWDPDVFFGTLFPFARTFIVLLVGLGVPLIMTPLSLRRALVQLVPESRRVPAFWQRIVLTVTLTIRFVPVLLSEWERFGRIFLARGKMARRTPGAMIRKLRDIALPLLLALFRMADEVALALESRGVQRDVQPTRSANLRWQLRDTLLTAGSVALGGMLLLLLD